ncbi:M56 family metallopeptidase [Lysobacter firmicutimachus]|uniref:M56 family metallopeptidase n=3 Tax=Lysobacter TaxID=68 RepID=A0ABU8D6I3_9GAMM
MSAVELLRALAETAAAMSLAIALVLALRRPLRRAFGAGVAYAAWWLVPLAVVAVLLPAAPRPPTATAWQVVPGAPMALAPAAPQAPVATLWVALSLLWLSGALAMALRAWRQQHRFERRLGRLHPRADGSMQAQTDYGLPAAMGLLRPKVVLPRDFECRYDTRQRRLIALHERIHIARGDLYANAAVLSLSCLYWFNPLSHYAARAFRSDQELACDQRVLRRLPTARRSYGEALLKAGLRGGPSPLACTWSSSHPLKERIAMLNRTAPSASRLRLGAAVLIALAAVTGFGAWAAQPASAPAERRFDLNTAQMSQRQYAAHVAELAGLRIDNPEILSDAVAVREARLSQIDAGMAFALLQMQTGLTAKIDGDRVRFAAGERPQAPGAQSVMFYRKGAQR